MAVVLSLSSLLLPPAAASQLRARVTTKYFNGTFRPDQVITLDGDVWLVAPANGNGADCRIGRLNPKTMAVATYALAGCGMNVTAGDGAVFLETTTANVKSQTYVVHIERFSTSTKLSKIFSTVSARLFLGSDIAHTQLAYASGSLWLYAMPSGGDAPEVMQLSPSTGAVERTFTSVPQIGGTEPIIAGAPGYVWLAGGAGSGADFLRIDTRSGTVHSVRPPGKYDSVDALASAGNQMFFTYLASPSAGKAVTQHVSRLSAEGTLLGNSTNEQVGTWLEDVSGNLFSVGPGDTCTSGLPVWSIDERTLRATAIADLKSPGDPCLGESSYRSVAANKNGIFDLYSSESGTVLYRVKPQ